MLSTSNHFTASRIEVPYHDEAYDMLLSWVCSQPFAQAARSCLVTVTSESCRRRGQSAFQASSGKDNAKKPLHYSPWNGRFYFWHQYRLFYFERRQLRGEIGLHREETSLSYLGRDPTVLRGFLDKCREHYLKQVKNTTCVFEHKDGKWIPSKFRNKRNLSTMVLNKKLKKALVNDISDFLNLETRKCYSERSIPYQRGYLLYGPPGTGKTSFSFSVAGEFDLDLYILNIPSLDDDSLKALFAELPQHCLVLLEDVDAINSKRAGSSNEDVGRSTSFAQTPGCKSLSLSTVLNVLDGIGSPEGRVLIMTTNQFEKLDSALIRPGRVDRKFEFPLADRDTIRQLFFFFYDPQLVKVSKEAEEAEETEDAEDAEDNKSVSCDLPQLAQEFVTKIPGNEFSPAEIISLLLASKQSPSRAVADIGAWMEDVRDERKKFGRAN